MQLWDCCKGWIFDAGKGNELILSCCRFRMMKGISCCFSLRWDVCLRHWWGWQGHGICSMGLLSCAINLLRWIQHGLCLLTAMVSEMKSLASLALLRLVLWCSREPILSHNHRIYEKPFQEVAHIPIEPRPLTMLFPTSPYDIVFLKMPLYEWTSPHSPEQGVRRWWMWTIRWHFDYFKTFDHMCNNLLTQYERLRYLWRGGNR